MRYKALYQRPQRQGWITLDADNLNHAFKEAYDHISRSTNTNQYAVELLLICDKDMNLLWKNDKIKL